MVRNYKRKSQRGKTYSKEILELAVKEVKATVLTYRMASKLYNIPETTLKDHVKGKRGAKSSSYGRKTDLSSDIEKNLTTSLCAMEKWGFGLSRKEVLDIVQQYVKANQIKTQFKDDRPGSDWFINFKKRNGLSIKKPQSVEMARKKSVDPFIIQPYFDLLKSTLDELALNNKPAQIWNLDESSFSRDPSKTKVVGKIGLPATRTTSGPGRENTTILIACSASGAKVPPLIVFKGKSIWSEWVGSKDLEYPGTSYAATKNGWMEVEVFENYLQNTFVKNIGPERPVLLIYDGHSTHISIKIIEMALAEQIVILKLPPHSSHLLQPLDIAVFRSLKIAWDAKLVAWQRRNPGVKIPKKQFSELIGQVWADASSEIIRNGFQKAGIFPYNNSIIPEEAYDPEALKRWNTTITLALTVPPFANEISVPVHNGEATSNNIEANVLLNQQVEENQQAGEITIDNTRNSIPIDLKCKPSTSKESEHPLVTFETLLLSSMKRTSTNLNEAKKKRKICNGAEVITTQEVLQRLKDKENLQQKTKSRTKNSAQQMVDDDVDLSLSTLVNTENKKDSKKKKKKVVLVEHDTSSEEDLSDIPDLSEDDELETFEEYLKTQEDLEVLARSIGNMRTEDWVLVKFAGKKNIKHYVGQITKIDPNEITVKYARKSNFLKKKTFFIFPSNEDISDVPIDDIICVLPTPTIGRRGEICFEVEFSSYNVQ